MQTPPRLGTALSIVAAFALAVLLPSAPVAGGNPADAPKIWTGIIVAPTSKLAPWAYEKFELRIFKQTTDDEAKGFVEVLRTGGQSALRQAMFHLEQRGWITIGRSVATNVNLIRVLDREGGGYIIRIFSAFPMRLLDKSDPPVDAEHPFGFMELAVDANNMGEGQLIAAAGVTITDGNIVMSSAGAPVFKLKDIIGQAAR